MMKNFVLVFADCICPYDDWLDRVALHRHVQAMDVHAAASALGMRLGEKQNPTFAGEGWYRLEGTERSHPWLVLVPNLTDVAAEKPRFVETGLLYRVK